MRLFLISLHRRNVPEVSTPSIITQPANILVVDDDPAVVRLLSRMLEQEGHRVRSATDGNTALQHVLQDCPEVLITDWRMPGIDGLELCRRIRQLHECKVLKHYTYIFLLTAQTGRQSLLEGLNAGADDFIEKNAEQLNDLRIEISVRLKTALRTRNMQRELEYAAKYDFLTSLHNRSTFFELGMDLWAKMIHQNKTLSAIMIDCDYFKRINDLYGHQTGDMVLKSFASVLQRHSRGYDMICRYGGEEFCALLPGCDEKVACQWAERIRKQLEKKVLVCDDKKINVTASFGVAERVEDVTTLDQLVERADQSLLFAKESGRNRTVCYSETLADQQNGLPPSHSMQLLFEGVSAADVMVPLVLTINENETVANVADFFIRTHADTLPVVDRNNHLVGFVSEKNLLAMVGDVERWQENIQSLITKALITYTPETPLKAIYSFLTRVSMKRVYILQGKRPIGFIGRNLLMRWLRNRWAMFSRDFEHIIPGNTAASKTQDEWLAQYKYLLKQFREMNACVKSNAEESYPDEQTLETKRNMIVSLVSHSQEVLEQMLMSCTNEVASYSGAMEDEENVDAGMYRRGLF